MKNQNKRIGQELILILYGIAFCLDLGFIIWAITTGIQHVVAAAWIRFFLETGLFFFLYQKAVWAKWSLVILWLATMVASTILFITGGNDRGSIQLTGMAAVGVVYAVMSVALLTAAKTPSAE